MTTTDDSGMVATLPLDDLEPAEAQAHARETWRASGGKLTGAELARR